ncbi:MAG: hypothetical protein IKD30_00915 [Peptococcaceae bacterium]|nr:hypothetical protein [Peptococcaceae bacterium]MBR2626796.1 hypothetical protein [Peptococcaceae bacterium]
MTETVLIIILSVIAIILAAGFIKQFLNDHDKSLSGILNDTGYQNSVTVRAKILNRWIHREQSASAVQGVVEYPSLLFETDDGTQMEFQVEYRLYKKVSIGQTGTLRYTGRRVDFFELDDTSENISKMFL